MNRKLKTKKKKGWLGCTATLVREDGPGKLASTLSERKGAGLNNEAGVGVVLGEGEGEV